MLDLTWSGSPVNIFVTYLLDETQFFVFQKPAAQALISIFIQYISR